MFETQAFVLHPSPNTDQQGHPNLTVCPAAAIYSLTYTMPFS